MAGRLHPAVVPILVACTGCLAAVTEPTHPDTATTGGIASGDSPDAGAADAGLSFDAGTAEDAGVELDAGALSDPSIRCSPSGLDFGLNAVGISSTLKLLCTNVALGSRNLIIGDPSSGASGLSIQNGDLAFSVAFDPPFPEVGLAPGESALVAVTYAPTAGGADMDTLLIASNDPTTPITQIGLNGIAKTLPDCEMTVEPTRIDLGNIEVGVEQIFPIEIRNVGVGECLVNGFRFVNFPFQLPDYPPGASTSVIIAGGDSLVIQVRLLLTVPGPWEGEIDFVDGPTPTRIRVTANVVAN